MIHIFHGEHIEASRKELVKLKEKFSQGEVVTLDGKSMTQTDFTQATESTSLFGGDRLVVIENLFSKRLTKKSKEIAVWLQVVKTLPDTADVLFWEEKELGKTILSNMPKQADVALFKPDKSIFNFVESIKPGNHKQMFNLFENVLAEESAEFAFVMLSRQLRLLIMVKELGKNIGLSPWQAAKLTKQAQSFTLPLVVTLLDELMFIDVRLKSGKSAFTLADELELWLTKI